jgi:hypothetical protein
VAGAAVSARGGALTASGAFVDRTSMEVGRATRRGKALDLR